MSLLSYMPQKDDIFSVVDDIFAINYTRSPQDVFAYAGEELSLPKVPNLSPQPSKPPFPKIPERPNSGSLEENLFKNHALKIAHKSPTVHDVIRGGFSSHVHGHAKRARVEHEDAMQQAIQDLVLDPGPLNLHHYDPQQHGDFRSFFRKMLGKSIYNQQKAEGRELSGLGGEDRSLELTPSGEKGGQSQRTKEGIGQPKIIDRVALRQPQVDESMHGMSLKDRISRLLERDPAMQWGEIVRLSHTTTEEARAAMAELQSGGQHGGYQVPKALNKQSWLSPSIRGDQNEIASRLAAYIAANPERSWEFLAQQAAKKLGMNRRTFIDLIESLRATGKIPKEAVIRSPASSRGGPRINERDDEDDIFRYAEPLAPLPTTASKIKPPSSGSAKPGPAMKPIMPRLGKAANLPSPIPPDTKVMMPSPHPEVPTAPKVPHALRAGNPDTLRQRIPRPPKPRYKLQVPLHDAYNTAYRELTEDMATLTHPEDIEDRKQEIGDLQDAFESGNDRLMVRFLEDHVGWKTFNSLVQSLHDKEPAVTSRKGLFARAAEDMFAYAENKPAQTTAAKPIPFPTIPVKELQTPPTVKEGASKPPLRKMGLHPIPEAKIDPWWHEMPHTNWLRHAEETHRERLPGGINSPWKISLAGEHPMSDYHAIWKASDNDQTAAARPQTIPEGNPHGHEAAAWEIAHLVGMGGMVPPTVSRENRGQIGSAQHFVPGQDRAFRSPFPFGKPGNTQLPLAAAFDALTMNTDRHMKNWLVDPESSQLTLIDHGLLFPHTHAKRLVGNGEILGNAMETGISVPPEVVKWEGQWPHIERSMKRNGLTDEQIALTQSRLASLADAARKGESFKHWLRRSGIAGNYDLK